LCTLLQTAFSAIFPTGKERKFALMRSIENRTFCRNVQIVSPDT